MNTFDVLQWKEKKRACQAKQLEGLVMQLIFQVVMHINGMLVDPGIIMSEIHILIRSKWRA